MRNVGMETVTGGTIVGGRYGASASEAAPSPPLIIGRSTNVGAAMPQPPPNPATHPDQSRLAGLPPAGMQAMQAALQAIRRGDAGEVLRLTGEVLGLVPGHPEALRLAGIAHAAGGHHDLARDALQRSHDRRPDDALVLIDLGNAQQRCGDHDAARNSWNKDAQLAPGHPMPPYNLGRSLPLEGRTNEAIGMLWRAAEMAQDFALARNLAGEALVPAGRFDEAHQHYRRARWTHHPRGE